MARTIAETFRNLRRKGQKALIPYVMGGDPDVARSEQIVRTLVAAGADIIELGIPFSDPLADGPAIQEAGQRAIRKGVICEDLFKMVARLRKDISVPLVFMTYYNPVFHFGLAKFCNRCAKSGVSGLIVPDLPLEESLPLEKETRRTGLDLIYLATPTSPPERVEKLAQHTRGFLYYVSRTGVTGARQSLPSDLVGNIRRIRKMTDIPIGVGFGIKDAKQATKVAKVADAVIIGSAIVRIVEEYGESPELVPRLTEFARPIADMLHSGL